MLEREPLGQRQHQPSRAGDQRGEQGVVVSAGLLALRRFDSPLPLRGEDRDRRIIILGVLDVEFDENAVAGGVGEDLQRELVHVQVLGFLAVRIAALGLFELGLDATPKFDDPFVEVVFVRIDLEVPLAGNFYSSSGHSEAA